jgi:hypothetical protein
MTDGDAGTGSATFRALTPFGETCDGALAFSFTTRSGRRSTWRALQAVVATSQRGPTQTDASPLAIGEGFDDTVNRHDVFGRSPLRGADECRGAANLCGVRDYPVDLTAAVPVHVRLQGDREVALEVRWQGQIAYAARSTGYGAGGYNLDLTLLPPVTGRYTLHVTTAAERINVIVSKGLTPNNPSATLSDTL